MCSVTETATVIPEYSMSQGVDIGRSFPPHVALLVPLSGPSGSVVAFHGLTGSTKRCL